MLTPGELGNLAGAEDNRTAHQRELDDVYERAHEKMHNEPMAPRDMINSLGVCATYLGEFALDRDAIDDLDALKRLMWVQQRLADIQKSIALHVEEIIVTAGT